MKNSSSISKLYYSKSSVSKVQAQNIQHIFINHRIPFVLHLTWSLIFLAYIYHCMFPKEEITQREQFITPCFKNNVHLIRVGSSYIFYFPTHLYILNCKFRTNTLHGTVIAVLLPDRRNLFYVQSKIHTDCF